MLNSTWEWKEFLCGGINEIYSTVLKYDGQIVNYIYNWETNTLELAVMFKDRFSPFHIKVFGRN